MARSTSALRSFVARLVRWLMQAILIWLVGSILAVTSYRFINPPITLLMIGRMLEGDPLHKQWTALDDMAASLPLAAIASEDAHFCTHHGFDLAAIAKAERANAHGHKLRGGSTISQQTAKNVFLWPARSWLRKGLEAWFTLLIEAIWPKKRIMEVYLNVAEWGRGVYGAQAAANHYFDVDASDLTPAQSARLVAILPSPRKWSPIKQTHRVARKTRNVRRALPTVRDALSDCL